MLPVWIVLMLLPILGGAERFNCRGRILGAYYADAKSGCKAFHVCVRVAGGGIRDFRFFCPPGTLFHQEAQTCTDWGDDDPLACPADLYDGQFDLYKIGSGYDTKKPSSPGNRDDETEFGLQRAETGDRRSQSNNAGSSGPASDLRAAHSSDFFSGQRDGGRDEPAPQTTRAQPSSPSRQSFRRPTSPRAPPTTTQYTTQSPPPPPQPSKHYDAPSKRKLVRKRPIYVSTASPTPFAQNTAQQSYSQQPQQNSNQRIHQSRPTTLPPANIPQYKEENYPRIPQNRPTTLLPANAQYKEDTYQRIPQNRPTNAPPANVPPQYKDEYVEVSRVTPKQTPNRYFPNSPTPSPFSQSTPAPQFKKEGLAELYNYEAQSTPGINVQNDNRPFKVRNSFSVSDVPREDFARTNFNSNTERNTPTTVDYNTATARGFATSTQAYKNFNSVSYESEKNNFVSFPGTKQNYFRSPTTTVSTTVYTTNRSDPLFNLNTVAYNTNIAFNTIQPSNYAETDEDDGQYRPTAGEDDGQYRPEVHERDRELLSGAHSLNIAASGNRLPEDQKPHTKSNHVKPQSHTSAPRPFRPAPTTTVAPTSRAPETTYTTTYRVPTVYTQRTFDYVQTYTTTSRPNESPVPSHSSAPISNAPPRLSTTSAPRSPEPRPQPRAQPPAPPTIAPAKPAAPARPAPAPARPAQPIGNKEDASYDYAYYDSDPGFSEYDHIEEFGKTKSRA